MRLKTVFTFLIAICCPLFSFASYHHTDSAFQLNLTIETIESTGDSSSSAIFEVEGIFLNVSNQNPVEGVEVTITNKRNNHYQIRMTGTDGKFRFSLHDESVFSIEGSKTYYFDAEQVNISTIGRKKYEKLEMKMPIERMQLNHPYIIKEIVFGINGDELSHDAVMALKRLHKMMLNNPALKIEIGVHTDSRGDDDYNLHLTEKRAAAILNKLKQLGLRGNRITAKGYGETKLLNHCTNNIRCNSPEHMQNRRVSFTILSF